MSSVSSQKTAPLKVLVVMSNFPFVVTATLAVSIWTGCCFSASCTARSDFFIIHYDTDVISPCVTYSNIQVGSITLLPDRAARIMASLLAFICENIPSIQVQTFSGQSATSTLHLVRKTMSYKAYPTQAPLQPFCIHRGTISGRASFTATSSACVFV